MCVCVIQMKFHDVAPEKWLNKNVMMTPRLDIWVWVKIRYPNNWMVNTKLDIHICGLILGLPF